MSRRCFTQAMALVVATCGLHASAADWSEQRVIDRSTTFPIQQVSLVGDGAGGYWHIVSTAANPGTRFLDRISRQREQAPLPTERLPAINSSGMMPLSADRVLLYYPRLSDFRQVGNLVVVNSDGIAVASADLPRCVHPVRDGSGGLWLACGQELRHLDSALKEIGSVPILDGRQPHEVNSFQLDQNDEWVLLTHDQDSLESCVIAMHPGGALRWRRCTPNHRRPRMTLADGRVYLDLGLTTATDPVLLDSIALDSGEVLRTEPYYTSSIPQAMGDRLVALRLDPETGESELASYAPESGWRPLRAITNGLVDFQVLDRDRIVLIEGSAAQTELIAIDSEGEVLWR